MLAAYHYVYSIYWKCKNTVQVEITNFHRWWKTWRYMELRVGLVHWIVVSSIRTNSKLVHWKWLPCQLHAIHLDTCAIMWLIIKVHSTVFAVKQLNLLGFSCRIWKSHPQYYGIIYTSHNRALRAIVAWRCICCTASWCLSWWFTVDVS